MNLVSKLPARKSASAKIVLVQRDRGLDSLHHELAQRALHPGDGFGAVDAVHNELGDERVVVGRDDAFGILRRVDANAVAAGHIERRDLAGRWRELDADARR